MTTATFEVYPRIYYETIRDTGIDPVACGPYGSELRVGSGPREPETGEETGRLAAKATAKASRGTASGTRRKASKTVKPRAGGTGVEAEVGADDLGAERKVRKTARGTAKVAVAG